MDILDKIIPYSAIKPYSLQKTFSSMILTRVEANKTSSFIRVCSGVKKRDRSTKKGNYDMKKSNNVLDYRVNIVCPESNITQSKTIASLKSFPDSVLNPILF